MKRVVFITQQIDPEHPVLAATVPKLNALAKLVDEVVVLADAAVHDVLPANCRLRTFRAGTKAGRGMRFAAALAPELRGLRAGGAVVAHMCPIYAVLAAPLVRPLRIPLVLWFTQWRASRLLRVAERVSTAVTSVDRLSFPLESAKVRGIGHGIDLAEFPCASARAPGDGLKLLALGRYSRSKGLEPVIRAAAAVEDATLDVHGPAVTADERVHLEELGRLVADLGVDSRIRLEGAVPRSRVPDLLGSHDALVNNTHAGARDKVVYEAAAGCVPVLAPSSAFDALIDPELRFESGNADELAERIRALSALGRDERAALGRRLRERVAEGHSVDSWARGIVDAAGIA